MKKHKHKKVVIIETFTGRYEGIPQGAPGGYKPGCGPSPSPSSPAPSSPAPSAGPPTS